jgi:hypothetical protein
LTNENSPLPNAICVYVTWNKKIFYGNLLAGRYMFVSAECLGKTGIFNGK